MEEFIITAEIVVTPFGTFIMFDMYSVIYL